MKIIVKVTIKYIIKKYDDDDDDDDDDEEEEEDVEKVEEIGEEMLVCRVSDTEVEKSKY